jgi:glycosyltransferase involved in cell wall biosynthesis
LVEAGASGWLVPAGAADALAAAMECVLASPLPKLEAMAARGRDKVRRQHDVVASAKQLIQLFGAA